MRIADVTPGNPKRITYLSLVVVVLFMGWLHYEVAFNDMPVKNTAWAYGP